MTNPWDPSVTGCGGMVGVTGGEPFKGGGIIKNGEGAGGGGAGTRDGGGS